MALRKIITNARTGHVNAYWRVTGMHIDALVGTALIVLSGYASPEARAAGRLPDDRREWAIQGASFAALAFGEAQGVTVYDAVAHACYALIKTARRPIPVDATMDEHGVVTLPNGETFGPEDIDQGEGDVPTVPSEFADAVDV